MQVTLQEAARLTDKSEMTIRRLAKKPGAKQHVTKTEDGKLLISLDFVYKHYQPATTVQQPATKKQQPVAATNQPQPEPEPAPDRPADPEHLHPAYVAALAAKDETIQELKHQLSRKDQQIESFQERAREQNIILQSLQNKLALPAPEPPAPATPKQSKFEWAYVVVIVLLLITLIAVMVSGNLPGM